MTRDGYKGVVLVTGPGGLMFDWCEQRPQLGAALLALAVRPAATQPNIKLAEVGGRNRQNGYFHWPGGASDLFSPPGLRPHGDCTGSEY